MRFSLGGVIARIILIAVVIGAIVIGASGRSEVHDNIKREKIVGTSDMTPDTIAAEVWEAGLWVTSTALSTALSTSYFAQQVALFSIVMGIALVLTGIGFLVLTLGVSRRSEPTGEAG